MLFYSFRKIPDNYSEDINKRDRGFVPAILQERGVFKKIPRSLAE